MPSGWVRLLQAREIPASVCVALRLALPGGVVTWFVTSFRTSFRTGVSRAGPAALPAGRGSVLRQRRAGRHCTNSGTVRSPTTSPGAPHTDGEERPHERREPGQVREALADGRKGRPGTAEVGNRPA
jgi:hypothetical protein